MFDVPVPVVLYTPPPNARNPDDIENKLPALEITAEVQPTPNENATIFNVSTEICLLTLSDLDLISVSNRESEEDDHPSGGKAAAEALRLPGSGIQVRRAQRELGRIRL